VNPLALEEFAALEQRHQFLTEQLTDLANTRRTCSRSSRRSTSKMESIFRGASRTPATRSPRCSRCSSRRLGQHLAHRPRRTAHHRHRGVR
jgi:hypothetical protein